MTLLGRGALAEVILLADGTTALKRTKRSLLSFTKNVRAAQQEQAALEVVSDGAPQHIVRLLGAAHDADYVGLRLEAVLTDGQSGLTLRALLATRSAPLPAAAAAHVGACLLRALAHVHGRGVVHRDLSPSNVMHRADGSPCVVDFGAARTLAPGERATTLCGTPDYVAPEVLLRSGHGCEADCWSCGALLFELVAGRAPFAAATIAELHANILAATPAPPLEEVATAAPAAAALLGALLAREPAERPTAEAASAMEWVRDAADGEEGRRQLREAVEEAVAAGPQKGEEEDDDAAEEAAWAEAEREEMEERAEAAWGRLGEDERRRLFESG
jgi:serine/threonine protein kinase